MNKSTTSLSFPDVNVWMALVLEHHVHRRASRRWWEAATGRIVFTRFTQISLLRLLTSVAPMDGKPLRMDQAWRVHDGLFSDERVGLLPEPVDVDASFRKYASGPMVAPKLWADAWLLAVAHAADGTLITFDRALAGRANHCLLLGEPL